METHWECGYCYEKGILLHSETSLMLEQVETKQGEVLLLALCQGNGDDSLGSVASGYACEEIGTWFYQELLLLLQQKKYSTRKKKRQIKKSGIRLFARIREELIRYEKRTKKRMGTAISILVCDNKRYYFFQLGPIRLLRFQTLWIRKETDDLGSKKENRLYIQSKKRKKQESFLLCSEGFLTKVREEDIRRALWEKEGVSEEQMGKILQEIASRSILRGETKMIAALYARSFCVMKRRDGAI